MLHIGAKWRIFVVSFSAPTFIKAVQNPTVAGGFSQVSVAQMPFWKRLEFVCRCKLRWYKVKNCQHQLLHSKVRFKTIIYPRSVELKWCYCVTAKQWLCGLFAWCNLPFPAFQKSFGHLPLSVHADFLGGVVCIVHGYTTKYKTRNPILDQNQHNADAILNEIKLQVFKI